MNFRSVDIFTARLVKLTEKEQQADNTTAFDLQLTLANPAKNNGNNYAQTNHSIHLPLDALIEIAKRLSILEQQHRMDSEEFFYQYSQGRLSDDAEFVEWANDYRHYLHSRQELDASLKYVA
ncbi:MAG: antitoxin TumA [Methylococcales bacterium]